MAALMVVAIAAGAGSIPARAAEPMSFRIESMGAVPRCRHHKCVTADDAKIIVAEGEIGNDTAAEFLSFLGQHLQDDSLRPVVLIQSLGGTVLGAMQLGTVFRRIGAAVIVASTADGHAETGDRIQIKPGLCMSACVYAFFGGKKRVVPSVSLLGIHRMAVYERSHDPAGGTMVTRSFGSDELVTELSKYTRMMGVDPHVIDAAESVAPESIHIVTPREIQRWRLGSAHL